ncbi:hypothetical protein BGZ63DRAFT_423450 [Mariannaea sp. PMI_226]|nr:hypothetical protein BGZ63DRAFT_423450 [Mariannaea sp. PMI_226]
MSPHGKTDAQALYLLFAVGHGHPSEPTEPLRSPSPVRGASSESDPRLEMSPSGSGSGYLFPQPARDDGSTPPPRRDIRV